MSFRGLIPALMLLSTCSCSDLPDITVNGTLGEAVSLPCKCPPDSPVYLVWQRVDQQIVVNHYKEDGEEDRTAPEYRNRTELKLRGTCSLVFHSLSLSDQGLYDCFYKILPLSHQRIHLLVTEKQQQQHPKIDQSTIVTSAVCVFIVFTIAAVCVGITCRKRHQTKRTFSATSASSI